MGWNHNLDFILERDKKFYGVEVKNTLGYLDKDEFYLKIELCEQLGIVPLFVTRMLPKNWVFDLIKAGGYALIIKYQLYPPYFSELVKTIRDSLGLPVDCPQSIWDGTIQRFINWHKKHVN